MNIFALSNRPDIAATFHCDKHVVKMILESTQILSTAIRLMAKEDTFISERLYKTTHQNHPCSIWARETRDNFLWLRNLAQNLCFEYTYRYGKKHKTQKVLYHVFLNQYHNLIPEGPLTPFVQAIPDELKHEDPVEGYRAYYNRDKAYMAKWTRRGTPFWFKEKDSGEF